MSIIELRDAAVRAGDRTLWSGVDLTVESGEFVAVLGPERRRASPRWSVRSSVCVPPSSGSITVLGGEPGSGNEHIGYLPQRRSFDADLQVRGVDVVRLGLDGTRWGLPLARSAPVERAGAEPTRRVFTRSSSSSTRRGTPTARSGGCPAASSSDCSSPRRSPRARACCCSTSRWTASTCPTRARSRR